MDGLELRMVALACGCAAADLGLGISPDVGYRLIHGVTAVITDVTRKE
jgi:hypothetical protein